MAPFSLKTFDNKLIEAYEKLDLKVDDEKHRKDRNHLARHAFNTMLKNNHVAEYDRKLYLGHSVGTQVNVGYTHRSEDEERKIVEVGEKYCRFLTKDIGEFQELLKR